MSSSVRCLSIAILTAVMLAAGLVGPASSEPLIEIPTTAAARLDGLPPEHRGGRVSQPVTTPLPFSMVGFEVPAGAHLEFRTSVDGRRWTPWTHAEVEPLEGPDPASAEGKAANRHMSQPVWVGEAARLQTRLDGGRPSVSASEVGVHLIDSSGLSRSWGRRVLDRLKAAWRGTPRPAEATVNRPTIVTRAQWGADERLRRSSPSYAGRITLGVVHHTAGANGYTRAQADDVVRGVYRYHVQSNGWSDVGYNFLVDRFGTVYEGRYGGVTRPVIGAHAGGFNTETFGVSLMGSFDGPRPPKAMRRALRRLLAWKYDLHHVNVKGSTTYTSYGSSKYAAGRTVRLRRLSGHRDVSLTSCPGGKTYAMLPNLRRQVARLQGPVLFNPKATPSTVKVIDGRSVSGAVTFSSRLRPAGPWTVTVRTAAGTPVHTATGYGTDMSARWLPVGVQPGTYRYTLASPGRRAATGTLRLRAPNIKASASAKSAVFDAAGGLRKPLTFTGELWNGADWRLRIRDAADERVFLATGTGKNLSATWEGPVVTPGRYTWRVAADGARSVTGAIAVTADMVERAGAADAPATAAAGISRRAFPAGSATLAVLAPDTSPALAQAGAGLAGRAGPLLYTAPAVLPEATLTELGRVLPDGQPLYVLGDDSFINETALTGLSDQWDVQRLAGATVADIAALAAPIVASRRPTQAAVLVGTGKGAWRQGVAGATYAARNDLPVLLTNRAALNAATAAAITDMGITSVTIVGNTDAVSSDVRNALPPSVRVGGKTAARAAIGVARRLFARTAARRHQAWQFANLERSDGWYRSAAGASLGARTNAALLVTQVDKVSAATRDYLAALGYSAMRLGRGVVLGDKYHVSKVTRSALARQLQ